MVEGCFMNVGNFVCNIYFCFLLTPLGHHGKDSLKFEFTQNLLCTKGDGF